MASKKVKTYNDKNKYTDTQLKLLSLKAKEEAGIKTKHEIITPDHVNLKDDTFKSKNVKNKEFTGKIITEKDLEAEAKEREKELERYREEFNEQLKTWIETDHVSDYDWLKPRKRDYLVRVFEMDISSFENFVDVQYEYSKILMKFDLKNTKIHSNVYPILKILKVGEALEQEERRYGVGDIVMGPANEIIGTDWNQDFLTLMQNQRMMGAEPNL